MPRKKKVEIPAPKKKRAKNWTKDGAKITGEEREELLALQKKPSFPTTGDGLSEAGKKLLAPPKRRLLKKTELKDWLLPADSIAHYEIEQLEGEMHINAVLFARALVKHRGDKIKAFDDVFPHLDLSTSDRNKMIKKVSSTPQVKILVTLYFRDLPVYKTLDPQKIVSQYVEIIESDLLDLFKNEGEFLMFKQIDDIPKQYRWMIQDLTISPNGAIRVKLLDKMKALEMVAQFAGLSKSADEKDQPGAIIFGDAMEGV